MSEKGSKKKIWEVDPVYINYLSSHHPEAIEFVKRNAEVIKNKRNIWLDIQSYTEFSDKASDGSVLPGTRKVILFKKIIFDIFPRKLKPQYFGDDTDFYRTLRW